MKKPFPGGKVEKINVFLGSRDAEYWEGSYGPIFKDMNLYVIDSKFVKTISIIDATGEKKYVAAGSGAFKDAKTKFESDWNLGVSSAISRLDSRDL